MGVNVRQRKHYGPRGVGTIRMLPASAGKVQSKWKEVRVTITDPKTGYKESYHLDAEDVTKTFGSWRLRPTKTGKTPEQMYIELTPDEDDIRSVRPIEGKYLLKFDRMAARLDPKTDEMMAPTIKHKPQEKVGPLPNGASWTNPPYDEFYALLKIVASEIGKKSPYDGIEVVKPVPYMFERNPDDGMVEIVYDRKFWSDQLTNFLIEFGFDMDADNLTPSENVLGEVQDILVRRSVPVRGEFQNGWLQRVLEPAPVGVSI